MITEKLLSQIRADAAALEQTGQDELARIMLGFSGLVVKETSETLDKEALLKQIQILTHQATLPKENRKNLLITSALFYLALFSSVKSIGSYLIEHRDRIAVLLGV